MVNNSCIIFPLFKQRNFQGIIVCLIVLIAFLISLKSNNQVDCIKVTSINHDLKEESLDLIEFSTFFGGTGDERGESQALNYYSELRVDSDGNIIIVGRSTSPNFPIKDAYQTTNHGGLDVIISKFMPNGSLIFSTFLGGSADDWANCVALDSNDNIVIGGVTGSSDFPLVNSYQDTLLGGEEADADIFIAKLSKNGQTLLYSTFFGGTGSDWCYAIDVNELDQIAFTGTTVSTNFPMVNAFENNYGGYLDCYVCLLEADGQSLNFSTYLSSDTNDAGRGIRFDSMGNIIVTGQIGYCAYGTIGSYQLSYAGGSSDVYLCKFKPNGSLDYFTFLGGTGYDLANDLIIDSQSNIILTGYTLSNNFPVKNAFQNSLKGSSDIFIAKFNAIDSILNFSTLLGGSSYDEGFAVSVDSSDNILVVGGTHSTNFPVYYNLSDVTDVENGVVLKFLPNGTFTFSTLLAGSSKDICSEVVYCGDQFFTILGFTYSSNFPTIQPYQAIYGGSCDFFLTKMNTIDLFIPIPESPSTPIISTEEISLVTLPILSLLAVFVFKRKR
ncbi:MAG: hypothetical protein FK734_20620 [Asgard group archaeon]|nr:hypothetical protein [Asgard group archaeon]